jgi:ATP-dependent Lon protease
VKEKTIAAKRSGVTELIFPQMNKKDFDELPEYVKRDLTVHFVTEYNDIFKVISSFLKNFERQENVELLRSMI